MVGFRGQREESATNSHGRTPSRRIFQDFLLHGAIARSVVLGNDLAHGQRVEDLPHRHHLVLLLQGEDRVADAKRLGVKRPAVWVGIAGDLPSLSGLARN